MDKALRDGLALIAAEGDRDKLGKAEYARTPPPARRCTGWPMRCSFPTLWDKLAAGSGDGRHEVHMRFLRHLAQAARDEFARAAPGIPCARIMRPRAEVRGRAALNTSLGRIFRDIGEKEFENA